MGCSGEKEKIEDKMMEIKLERMEIKMEKEKELKKLCEMQGRSIKRTHIPDYIDPQFAREKQIEDYDDDEEIEFDKSTNIKKKKKGKNKNKNKKNKKH